MKYCPDCGKELGTGVVKCSNPDCGAEFMVPVDTETSDPPIKKSDELRQLEMEYKLSTRGVAARAPRTYAAMIVGFLIFLVLLWCSQRAGNSCFPAGRLFRYSALLRLPYSSIIPSFTGGRANSRRR